MSDEYKWLKPRVETLVEVAKPLSTIHSDVFYETGEWSIIKLLALQRFVNIYTKIIKGPKQSGIFDNMYYIDLLAGSGLCRIGKAKDIVAGSAVVAATQCYHPFDRYFLAEKNPESAQALNDRMKTVTSNYDVFNCDCNDCIEEIMSKLGTKDHYLAFVDCQGLDVSWATMQKLFAKNGDVLFNFQTQGICRIPPKIENRSQGWEACIDRLNWFFGDERWKECREPDDFLRSYVDKIVKTTSREIALPLPVVGPRGYRYDIILATRRTSGGSPWIKPMEQLQNVMGGYKPEIVKQTLDFLMKRQLTLNNGRFG